MYNLAKNIIPNKRARQKLNAYQVNFSQGYSTPAELSLTTFYH